MKMYTTGPKRQKSKKSKFSKSIREMKSQQQLKVKSHNHIEEIKGPKSTNKTKCTSQEVKVKSNGGSTWCKKKKKKKKLSGVVKGMQSRGNWLDLTDCGNMFKLGRKYFLSLAVSCIQVLVQITLRVVCLVSQSRCETHPLGWEYHGWYLYVEGNYLGASSE